MGGSLIATVRVSDPVLLGTGLGSSATATATCLAGTVTGGGGRIIGAYPDGVAITLAVPLKDPDGFMVQFTRFIPVEDPTDETNIIAYAICAEIGTTV